MFFLQFLNSPNLSFDIDLTSTPVSKSRRYNAGEKIINEKEKPDILVTPNPSLTNSNSTTLKEEQNEETNLELCVTPPPSIKCSYDPFTPTPIKKKMADLTPVVNIFTINDFPSLLI